MLFIFIGTIVAEAAWVDKYYNPNIIDRLLLLNGDLVGLQYDALYKYDKQSDNWEKYLDLPYENAGGMVEDSNGV